MTDHERSIEPHDVFHVLRRHYRLILLCIGIGAGAALAWSLVQTKEYTATASLLFRDPGFDERLFGGALFRDSGAEREQATNVQLVSLAGVADRTADTLGGDLTGGAVSAAIDIEAKGQSNVVDIAAHDPDPEFAARLANTFAQNYIEFRRDADKDKIAGAKHLVQRDLERLTPTEQESEQGTQLQQQISELSTLKALQTGNAELVQQASVPSAASSPRTERNIVLGGMLGLIFGVILAFMLERIDHRLRDPDEFEATYGQPTLATVLDSRVLSERTVAGQNGELSPAEAESFRMLRTRLRYFNVDRDIRVVLVTSPSPGDGKTTVGWNLALTAAEAGSTVAFVEVDFHRPKVAERTGLSPIPGLAELLTGQTSLESATQQVPVESRANGDWVSHTLDVIVAGAAPPNPAALTESREMQKLLAHLRSAYDLVVIDTPPMTAVADAIPLVTHVDGVVIVGQLSKTTREEAEHLREQLSELDAPVLGVVVNRASRRQGYAYSYHGEEPQRGRLRFRR